MPGLLGSFDSLLPRAIGLRAPNCHAETARLIRQSLLSAAPIDAFVPTLCVWPPKTEVVKLVPVVLSTAKTEDLAHLGGVIIGNILPHLHSTEVVRVTPVHARVEDEANHPWAHGRSCQRLAERHRIGWVGGHWIATARQVEAKHRGREHGYEPCTEKRSTGALERPVPSDKDGPSFRLDNLGKDRVVDSGAAP